jgi:hypothetical protein
MKIHRRKEFSFNQCVDGMWLWLTPTLFYILNKIMFGFIRGSEWIWYVVIIVLFVLWFNMNFKIVKNK